MRKPILPRTYLQTLTRHERKELLEGAYSSGTEDDVGLHGGLEASALRDEVERLGAEIVAGHAREQALQAQLVSAQRLLGVQLNAGRDAAGATRGLRDAVATHHAKADALHKAVAAARAECDVLKDAVRDLEAGRDKLKDELVAEKSRCAALQERYLQLAQGMMPPQAAVVGEGGTCSGPGSGQQAIRDAVPQNLASVLAQLSLAIKQRDSLANRCKELTNRLELTTCKSKAQGVRKAVVMAQGQQQRSVVAAQQRLSAMSKRMELQHEELQQKIIYIARLEKAMLAQHVAMRQMASKMAMKPGKLTPRTMATTTNNLGHDAINLGQHNLGQDQAWQDLGSVLHHVLGDDKIRAGDAGRARDQEFASSVVGRTLQKPYEQVHTAQAVSVPAAHVAVTEQGGGECHQQVYTGGNAAVSLHHDLRDIRVVEDELATLHLHLQQLSATALQQRPPSPDHRTPAAAMLLPFSPTASPSCPDRTEISKVYHHTTAWTSPTHQPHPHQKYHTSPTKAVIHAQQPPPAHGGRPPAQSMATLLSYPSHPDEPYSDNSEDVGQGSPGSAHQHNDNDDDERRQVFAAAPVSAVGHLPSVRPLSSARLTALAARRKAATQQHLRRLQDQRQQTTPVQRPTSARQRPVHQPSPSGTTTLAPRSVQPQHEVMHSDDAIQSPVQHKQAVIEHSAGNEEAKASMSPLFTGHAGNTVQHHGGEHVLSVLMPSPAAQMLAQHSLASDALVPRAQVSHAGHTVNVRSTGVHAAATASEEASPQEPSTTAAARPAPAESRSAHPSTGIAQSRAEPIVSGHDHISQAAAASRARAPADGSAYQILQGPNQAPQHSLATKPGPRHSRPDQPLHSAAALPQPWGSVLSPRRDLTGVQRSIQLLAEASQGSASSGSVREWHRLGELLQCSAGQRRSRDKPFSTSRSLVADRAGADDTMWSTYAAVASCEALSPRDGEGGVERQGGWARHALVRQGRLWEEENTPHDDHLRNTAEVSSWASPAPPYFQERYPGGDVALVPVGDSDFDWPGRTQPISPEPLPVPTPAWMPRQAL